MPFPRRLTQTPALGSRHRPHWDLAICGVNTRRPLRRKFMKTSSALMNIIQNTKATSTPVPLQATAQDLHVRVARLSGKTSRFTEIRAVAASGAALENHAVAVVMAPSSFLAH